MIARPLLALLWVTVSARGGNYAMEPATVDTGGGSCASVNYGLTAASTAGGHGSSGNYISRSGFAGQLGAAVGIAISAEPLTFSEMGMTQLSADLLYDDGLRFPLPAEGVTWSVLAGPIAEISVDGVATAAAVYQDEFATLRGASGPYVAVLELNILNILTDNFSPYASDDLPDSWQVLYFGTDATQGGKYDDFDSDGVGNLIEFACGTDPSQGGRGELRFVNGVLLERGLPTVEFSPTVNSLPYRALFLRRKHARLDYRPQFSRNLVTWSNATTPLEVLADDGEFEVVGVRFPIFIGGIRSSAKFFRLNPTVLPE